MSLGTVTQEYKFPKLNAKRIVLGSHFLNDSVCASFSDYDAVLTEAGDYTSKFFKLRQLFSTIIGNYKSYSQNIVAVYCTKSD